MNVTMKWTRTLAATAAIAATGLFTANAVAADKVDFSGKTVEFIVPYTEGGGTDVYARLFQPFLKKHLPGNPNVIIRNLPGGGSVMGSNRFEATAKPDGLMIVATSSSTLVAQLLGGDKRKFDTLAWRQIIVSPQGTIIYASKKTGVSGKDILADIKKLSGQKLRYGAKQPDAGELRNIFAFELLGMKVETIFGLARGEVRQAMQRNEIELNHDTAETYFESVEPLVKEGEVVPLMSLGYAKRADIIRDPLFPDLPTVGEAYKALNGKDPSGPLWDTFTAFVNLAVNASKGIALPKGTPDAIRDAYIEAVKKSVADPEFLKLAGNETGHYPQLFGDDADFAIKQAVGLPPEVSKWLKDFMLSRYDMKI
jgi:tripartite-type tricarboxylate transporter receptor subunit TctC